MKKLLLVSVGCFLANSVFLAYVFLASVLFANDVWADTHYLATTGTDTQDCTATPCLSLQYTMSQIASGDTIQIADGSYHFTGNPGYDNYIDNTHVPPSGPGTGQGDARFTIIAAENPGSVVFDLGSNGQQFIELSSQEVDFLKIEGILVTNANTSGNGRYLVQITGGSSDHLYFSRCGFYKSGSGGGSSVWINTDHNLFEECYFYGKGKYGLHFHTPSQYNVVRRSVFRSDDADGGSQPIGALMFYESTYNEAQNCIVIDMDRDYWQNYSWCLGGFATHAVADGNGTDFTYFRGDIVLNCDFGYRAGATQSAAGFGIMVDGHGSADGVIENCVVWGGEGYGIFGDNQDRWAVNNCTVGDMDDTEVTTGDGIRLFTGADTAATNNIVVNNRRYGLYTVNGNDHNNVSGNGTDFSTVENSTEPHGVTYDPLVNGLDYLVRIEEGSNLKIAGRNGNQIGAQITKRYGVDGTFYGETGYNTLTDVDLWPFPFEEHIRNHMRAYSSNGGPEGSRGFCSDGQTLTRYIWEFLGNEIPSDIYPAADGGMGDATPVVDATTVDAATANDAADAADTNDAAAGNDATTADAATVFDAAAGNDAMTADAATAYDAAAANDAATGSDAANVDATPVVDATLAKDAAAADARANDISTKKAGESSDCGGCSAATDRSNKAIPLLLICLLLFCTLVIRTARRKSHNTF